MSAQPDDQPVRRLRHAAVNLGVAHLGPSDAAALLARLAYLEGVEQRAREVAARRVAVDETSHPAAGRIGVERVTARYILGEDG